MASEKENKNQELSFEMVIRIMVYIILTALGTYAVMAVITHFSLNYLSPGYSFSDSLYSVLDTNTPIFKFVIGFGILSLATVFVAVFIKLIKEKVF